MGSFALARMSINLKVPLVRRFIGPKVSQTWIMDYAVCLQNLYDENVTILH
jgi:hypothetical protein